MPLELFSKTYDCKEALEEIDNLKRIAAELLEPMRKEYEQSQLPSEPPLEKVGEAAAILRRQISQVADTMNFHDRTLSVVVEGSMRRAVPPREALDAVDKTRQAVVEFLESTRKDWQAQLPKELSWDEIREPAVAFRMQTSRIADALEDHKKKLSAVVEGSMRQLIRLKKGDLWVTSARIESASDLVAYIARMTNESEGWVWHATGLLIDELKSSNAVIQLMKTIESTIRLSDWGAIADLIDAERAVVEDKIRLDIVARLINHVPPYLKNPLKQIFQMVDSQPGNALYQDYAHFFTTEASLMCLIMLSDYAYQSEPPPHHLLFDCCGSITLALPKAILIEGGEIRSSSSGEGIENSENRLELRLKLLALVLPKLYSDVSEVLADGWTFAPCLHVDHEMPLSVSHARERREGEILSLRLHRQITDDF